MINQIAPILKTTTRLTTLNKDLAKVRLIQARVKGRHTPADKPENGILWSPITAGPYMVPVLRWIE